MIVGLDNECLESPQILPLSFGAEVLDSGGFAQVSCIVTRGDQPLRISWTFHGADILSAELGITTVPLGPSGSALLIPSVGHKHRGKYSCSASNEAGTMEQTVELRVNGQTGRRSLEIFLLVVSVFVMVRYGVTQD